MPAHHAGASGVSGTAGQAPADPLVARVKQQTAEVHAAAVDAVDRAIARGGALDAVGAKVCVRCVRCAASPEVALLPLRAQSSTACHTRTPEFSMRTYELASRYGGRRADSRVLRSIWTAG